MKKLTLKQLREECAKENHGLAGYYNGGELYVNNTQGETIFQRDIDWETSEELCQDLKLTLKEV